VWLDPGGRGLFPLEGTAGAGPAPEISARPVDASERFRAHARDREYASAYQLLVAQPGVVGVSVGDLMLAADVARLSGHPAAAIPYLERVIRDHAGSGQAPLAAFTLGRIYSGMGRDEQAAAAFSKASGLDPKGPLAEDALARRVEHAYRAGDRSGARRLAEQYLSTYPSGRRRDEVLRLGGIR
jgi:transmembrane sensor